MMTSDWPSDEVERTSSTWLMVLTASSTFLVISVSISSGDAPGLAMITSDGGDVDLGEQIDAQAEIRKDAHHHQRQNQHGGEDRPADAELGECVHVSCLDLPPARAVEQFALVRWRRPSRCRSSPRRCGPGRHRHLASDHHAQARRAVFDGEDLVGVGGLVADHGAARHEDGVFAARQQHARGGEHAGAQFARSGFSKRASRMKTRELGSTEGLMAVTLPVKSRSGIGGDAGHHRHSQLARARRAAPASAIAVSGCRCGRWWRSCW